MSRPNLFSDAPEIPRLGRLLDSVLGRVVPSTNMLSNSYVSNSLSISRDMFPSSYTWHSALEGEDFDSSDDLTLAAVIDPPDTYDFLLQAAEYANSASSSPLPTPWVSRALAQPTFDCYATKYKPVCRKV